MTSSPLSFLAVPFLILLSAIESSHANSVTTSWKAAAPLPAEERHHPITFANETHGFLLSGSTRANPVTNDFYMYDEATNQWIDLSMTSSAFPGVARSYGYGVVLNEDDHPKAYLGLGADSNGTPLSDWWEFDMSTHVWTQLADFPLSGRRHPAMNAVRIPSSSASAAASWEIHVGLGDDRTQNFNDWWLYSIANDAWESLPSFPGSQRHHPFYFALGSRSYAGLGHSDGRDPYIEKDWYRFENGSWQQEQDFASYSTADNNALVSTEARVAGTQFAIELPPFQSNADSMEGGADIGESLARNTDINEELSGSLGFVLSGDGDNHSSMDTGEFHVFQPGNPNDDSSSSPGYWHALPPHPGPSRWAPGSFVMRGTARVYFTCGFDRSDGTLHNDLWTIDLSELFVSGEGNELSEDGSNSQMSPTSMPSGNSAAMSTSRMYLGMMMLQHASFLTTMVFVAIGLC